MLVTSPEGALTHLVGAMGGDAQPQIISQLLARLLRSGQDPATTIAASRLTLDAPGAGPFRLWWGERPHGARGSGRTCGLDRRAGRRGHRVRRISGLRSRPRWAAPRSSRPSMRATARCAWSAPRTPGAPKGARWLLTGRRCPVRVRPAGSVTGIEGLATLTLHAPPHRVIAGATARRRRRAAAPRPVTRDAGGALRIASLAQAGPARRVAPARGGASSATASPSR